MNTIKLMQWLFVYPVSGINIKSYGMDKEKCLWHKLFRFLRFLWFSFSRVLWHLSLTSSTVIPALELYLSITSFSCSEI